MGVPNEVVAKASTRILNFQGALLGLVGSVTRRYLSYERKHSAYADMAVRDADRWTLATSRVQLLAYPVVKTSIICKRGITDDVTKSIDAKSAYILFVWEFESMSFMRVC